MRASWAVAVGALGAVAGIVATGHLAKAFSAKTGSKEGPKATVTYVEFTCVAETDPTGVVTAQDCKMGEKKKVTGTVRMPSHVSLGFFDRNRLGAPDKPLDIETDSLASIEIDGLAFAPDPAGIPGLRQISSRGAKVSQKGGVERSGRLGSFGLTVTTADGEEVHVYCTNFGAASTGTEGGNLLLRIVFHSM